MILHRLTTVPGAAERTALMRGDGEARREEVAEAIPVDPLIAAVQEFMERRASLPAGKRPSTDGELSGIVHALLPLTVRQATDMRMWHWLTTCALRSYVLWRFGNEPSEERWFGANSQSGIARNAIARLWWAGHVLGVDGDYSRVRALFAKQDHFVGIFERYVAIYPNVIRVLAGKVEPLLQEEARQLQKRITFLGGTTALENLSDEELNVFVEESLRAIGVQEG